MSYLNWSLQYPLIFHLIVLTTSLIIVMKAADLLITGAVGFSQKFGLSDYVTGFLIIGIGTSLPELVAALMGNGLGDSGIVFGTVLGSAVVTVTLVLGIEAYVAKTLPIQTKMLGMNRYLVPLLMAFPIILVTDGSLSRADGFVLISIFFVYLYSIWQTEGSIGHLRNVKLKIVWKDMFIYLGAFVALLLGARFLVFSAIFLSKMFGIPSFLIALFVIGIGASIGDLAVDLKSIRTGHKQLAVGDVLSGLVVEMVFILGIIALVKPIVINPLPLVTSAIFGIVPLAGILYVAKKQITRKHGIVLIGLFGLFALVQLLPLVF